MKKYTSVSARMSAGPFGPVLVLISYPFKDDDEPKTLAEQNIPVCLKGRDGIQSDVGDRTKAGKTIA